MSVADKQVLLNRIATDLGSELTVNQLNTAMSLLTLKLDEFDVSFTGNSPESGNELLEAFLSAKDIEGKSAKTITRYRYIITRMLSSLKVPISSINVYHLRSYLSTLKSNGLSDSTLRGIRDIFSSFFGWLYREGLITKNPAGNLTPVKAQKKVREPFSESDIEKLKESCDNIRDKTIICFLRSSGCRVSELCALNRDDLDLKNKRCTVLGKGNKQRLVYLDDITVMFLTRYLETRIDDNPALFTGKGTDRLTTGGIRFMLNTIAQKAGVENVHPHRFRRTLATSLIDHGMAIQEVATLLGHDKIDTTMTYVFITQDHIQSAYNRYQ